MFELKLKEIANVQSGLVVARKKALAESQIIKSYFQLNLTSVSKDGYIIKESLDVLNAKEIISNDYLTREGDIVVRLTAPYTAVYIEKKNEGIVVSSNFCLVRNVQSYSKKFLGYFLNCNAVKKYFSSNTQGSTIMNISNAVVEEILIPTIDIKTQEWYSKILKLQIRKIEISEKISECESRLLKQLLKKIEE